MARAGSVAGTDRNSGERRVVARGETARMVRMRPPDRRLLSMFAAPVWLASAVIAVAGCGDGPSDSAAQAATSKKAGIEIGVGMAGVEIGMTQGQVRNRLGKPRKSFKVQAAFGPGRLVLYRYPKLDVEFWRGAPRTPSGSKPPDKRQRVASMVTTRKSERTSKGIGVGSTERQVKRNVAGVKCENLEFDGKTYRNCHVGSYRCKPPSWVLGDLPCRVTAFVLERKRVARVQVGWLGSPAGSLAGVIRH